MDRREEFQRWLVKEMRLPTMEADTLHRIFTPQMSEMWSNYSKRLVDPKRYERFKRICYIKHGDERKEPISNRNKSLYSDPSFVDAELVLQKTTISDIQLPRIFYGPEESMHKTLLLKRGVLRATTEFVKMQKSQLHSLRDCLSGLNAKSPRDSDMAKTEAITMPSLAALEVLDLQDDLERMRQELIDSYDELQSLQKRVVEAKQRSGEELSNNNSSQRSDYVVAKSQIRGWDAAIDILKQEMSLLIVQKQRLPSLTLNQRVAQGKEAHCVSLEHLQHSLNRYHWLIQSVCGEYEATGEAIHNLRERQVPDVTGLLQRELERLREIQLCSLFCLPENHGGSLVRMDETPQYKWGCHPSFVEMRSLLGLPFHSTFDQMATVANWRLERMRNLEKRCAELEKIMDSLQVSDDRRKNENDIKVELRNLRTLYGNQLDKVDELLCDLEARVPALVQQMQAGSQQAYDIFASIQVHKIIFAS